MLDKNKNTKDENDFIKKSPKTKILAENKKSNLRFAFIEKTRHKQDKLQFGFANYFFLGIEASITFPFLCKTITLLVKACSFKVSLI